MYHMKLSQNADKALNIIYQKHQSCKNDNIHAKLFHIKTLFPDTDTNELMPTLIELSKNRTISFFSNGQVIINHIGINYIENKLAKKTSKTNNFST